MKPSKQWKKSSRWRLCWKNSNWKNRSRLWNLVVGERAFTGLQGKLYCSLLQSSERVWKRMRGDYMSISPWVSLDKFPTGMGDTIRSITFERCK